MKKKQSSHKEISSKPQPAVAKSEGQKEAEKEIPSIQDTHTISHVEELAQVQAALTEANEKYVRLYAEFENFRRRSIKEQTAILNRANEVMLKELLPIVDDFGRALASITQDSTPIEAIKEGIRLVHDKFTHFFQQVGVRPMEIEVGTTFDAELHEAVTQNSVEDKALQGKVVEVIEKGYCLNDKILRFAKVVIGA